MKEKNYKDTFLGFLKKYGYILVLSVLMLALSIVLILSATKSRVGDTDGVDTPPANTAPVSFYSPVLNFRVAKEFSSTELLYNATLKQWEANKSLALSTGEGAEVYAVLDGVVEDVYSNYLNGYVVVISHEGNLKTYYSSLDEDVKVKKGETVTRGQVIGKAGETANAELDLGTHLTFAVMENNVKVDPADYLDLGDK